MRIVHIVCTYPPYYGGMGNAVFQLASGLLELGHEVEVLTPQYYEAKEMKPKQATPEEKHSEQLTKQIENVNRVAPAFQYGNAAYLPQVKNELDDFDLVHLHYPFFGTANLVRQWKEAHPEKPLVITYHMDTRGSGLKGLIFKNYAKYWMPKILRSADRLITTSFDFIESSDAKEIYFENQEKWIELPLGVDVNRFEPRDRPEALFQKHGLSSEIPTILFVGGMDKAHYFKGVEILLQALYIIKENDLKVQAVLVGDGKLRDNYQKLAKTLGIQNQVCFAGQVSDEELAFYYNMADLFVLPSINQGEAFGMVLLEAMASGVPVIASDLPGVRKIALEAGLTVRPNDSMELAESIVTYFSENNDQLIWQNKARSVALEKYAWEPIVKRLEEIYQQLV